MVDMSKKYVRGVQSHAQLCDHGFGVHESAIDCSISGSSSLKWSSRPCVPKVTMVDDAIYEFFRLDPLNSYVFRDLDLQNLQSITGLISSMES